MPSETESKNVFMSLSFWGLIAAVISPLLAKYGIIVDPGSLAAQIVALIGAGVGLYGILRRPDIHVRPQK